MKPFITNDLSIRTNFSCGIQIFTWFFHWHQKVRSNTENKECRPVTSMLELPLTNEPTLVCTSTHIKVFISQRRYMIPKDGSGCLFQNLPPFKTFPQSYESNSKHLQFMFTGNILHIIFSSFGSDSSNRRSERLPRPDCQLREFQRQPSDGNQELPRRPAHTEWKYPDRWRTINSQKRRSQIQHWKRASRTAPQTRLFLHKSPSVPGTSRTPHSSGARARPTCPPAPGAPTSRYGCATSRTRSPQTRYPQTRHSAQSQRTSGTFTSETSRAEESHPFGEGTSQPHPRTCGTSRSSIRSPHWEILSSGLKIRQL